MTPALTVQGLFPIAGFEEGRAAAYFADRSAGVCCGLEGLRLVRERLRGFFPRARDLATLRQVHGARVLRAPLPEPDLQADGLLTDQPGIVLAILTADCAPVFYSFPEHPAVGLAHVGWRGARAGLPAGLLAEARSQFGARAASARVALGPCLRRCCYEVGAEFEAFFPGFVGPDARGVRRLDLAGAIRSQLEGSGVAPGAISDCGICTACDRQRCFSYRREGAGAGRNISMVLIA